MLEKPGIFQLKFDFGIVKLLKGIFYDYHRKERLLIYKNHGASIFSEVKLCSLE